MMSWCFRFAILSLALLCWLDGCAQKSAPPPMGATVPQNPAGAQTGGNPAATTNINPNISTSRLDRQPWPPGMGQPLSPLSPQPGIAAGVPTAATSLPPPVISSAPVVPMGGKIKVAILLPLNGRSAALGQAMLNAAQQAVFDVAGPNFELMPRDTGDSESGADTAARDALASGAQLLIGPLFSAQIPAVRNVAQMANVNVLSLSTDTTQAGSGVYIMGFAPAPQIDRVAHYAMAHGLKRFAALIPNTPYGQLVGQAFQNAVTREGGLVVATQSYDPNSHDIDAQTRNLLTFRNQVDALFLPEGGTDLARVNAQLVAAGADGHSIRLIGTGLWDMPDLGAQDPALIGGLYAASDINGRHNFVAAYKAAYSQDPPRLATLAYDATALAATLARRNAAYDQAALTNPNGFAGVDGIFRLTSQGLAERGLAVNEVTASGPQVIDPAPNSFIAYGY